MFTIIDVLFCYNDVIHSIFAIIVESEKCANQALSSVNLRSTSHSFYLVRFFAHSLTVLRLILSFSFSFHFDIIVCCA